MPKKEARCRDARINPILLGVDVESGEEVCFSPDPASCSAVAAWL
jgi:hypothetical protein